MQINDSLKISNYQPVLEQSNYPGQDTISFYPWSSYNRAKRAVTEYTVALWMRKGMKIREPETKSK